MLETATKYILDLLTENEELKKFPKEFVNESVKWVKSWFLKPEDPKTNAKLEDPNKPIEVKKDIIQDKLEGLKDNPQFIKELTERLAAFEQQKTITKFNVIEGGSFKVQKDVHIGTVGASNHKQADEENVIKNAQFDVGGDFRLGNTTHIVHNYFSGAKISEKAPPQYNDVKANLKALLVKGKTAQVFEQLLDLTEKHDEDAHNTVLLLSAQLNRLNAKETNGLLSYSEATTERNRLTHSLIRVIDDLTVS
jgi:hypothetical protein